MQENPTVRWKLRGKTSSLLLVQRRGIWLAGDLEVQILGIWLAGDLGTHLAPGSNSDHTRTNSSRWWGPRIDSSRVRYSKLSMMTATKRFNIWKRTIKIFFRSKSRCVNFNAMADEFVETPAFKTSQGTSFILCFIQTWMNQHNFFQNLPRKPIILQTTQRGRQRSRSIASFAFHATKDRLKSFYTASHAGSFNDTPRVGLTK